MSLQLEKPIKISFEEIEIDDHIPSIKFSFITDVEQFSNFLQYKGDLWIDCSVWDQFVNDLITLKDIAVLNDMDEMFFIKIEKTKGIIEFCWSVTRQSISNDIIQSSYKTVISEDIFNHIKTQFVDYPKWW
ncbi:hypothetical protein PT273_01150 [Orbaceae bacterium ESL0727]|nr:hypothetical protein [Orbaceae bacterium ESL0727]